MSRRTAALNLEQIRSDILKNFSSCLRSAKCCNNGGCKLLWMGGENEEEQALLDLICAVISKLRHRLFPKGGGVQVSIPF